MSGMIKAARSAAMLSVVWFVACSTVQTVPGAASAGALQTNDRVQLLVRSGSQTMDRLLYEMAYQKFSDVLPIREKEPYTATLEVTFASTTQGGFIGSSSTTSNATAYGSGWYTGTGYVGQVAATGTSNTVSSGGTFEWQNSTMLMVLKRADGERLWSADYNYKGGWELSGWVVNTPEEAARLVTKRLRERFAADLRKSAH